MNVTILGNPQAATETASPADTAKRQRRRDAGWMVRALNASLFPETKWVDCGNPLGKQVALKNLAATSIVQPSGIATCASPWACLSCAAKIRSVRAKEVDHLVKAHLALGKGVTFLTFTIPHQLADELATRLGTIKKAWRLMVSGSAYAGRKQPDGTYSGGFKNDWGIVGNIRALEITDGKAGCTKLTEVIDSWGLSVRGKIYERTRTPTASKAAASDSEPCGGNLRERSGDLPVLRDQPDGFL